MARLVCVVGRASLVWGEAICGGWRRRHVIPARRHLCTAGVRLYGSATNEDLQQSAEHDEEGGGGVKGPTAKELQNEEPWMQEEIKAYYRGKRRLAEMMGCDPETFTDKDIKESLRYLLPTRLFDEDARPFLKHPSEIYPKRTESMFDATTGRPLESAFYTGFPAYHNLIYRIFQHRKLLEGTGLPDRDQSPGELSQERAEEGEDDESGSASVPKHWVKKDKLANILAEDISDQQYEEAISRLQQLSDHPHNSQVTEFLDQFRHSIFVYRSHTSIPHVKDGWEEVKTIGRRKTSCAVVRLRKGEGQVTINGCSFIKYFPRVEDRQQVLYPLTLTGLLGQYDITVSVHGGGVTGQAGAIRLGISKALISFPGSHHAQLGREGLLVRDPRMVERKKPGQKKARKKFAWVKR